MTLRDEDPNFTGSSKSFLPKQRVRVSAPATISIATQENYDHGKLVSTYFPWTVTMFGDVIARSSNDGYTRPARSYKAAVAAARRAARAYCDHMAIQAET